MELSMACHHLGCCGPRAAPSPAGWSQGWELGQGGQRELSLLLCVFLTHFPLLPTKARFLRLISEAVGDAHVNPVL